MSSLPFAMLDHGGSLCLEEHSKSKLVYKASNVKSIKSKHVAGYSICILKNSARGYPATVTAMLFLLLGWRTVSVCQYLSLSVLTVGLSPAVLVSQLFLDEMEFKKKHCLESTRINIAQLLSIWEPEP